MATSVHSIHTASLQPHDTQVARPPRSDRGFAATLKTAQGSHSGSLSTPQSGTPEPQADDANSLVFELGEPITNTAVADVVANVVTRSRSANKPARINAKPAPSEQNATPDRPQTAATSTNRAASAEASTDKPADSAESDASATAVTYSDPAEPKALRCSFPSPLSLALSGGEGKAGNADSTALPGAALASAAAMTPENAPAPTGGELVFQLALQTSPALPPTEEPPLPANTDGTPETSAIDLPVANEIADVAKPAIPTEAKQQAASKELPFAADLLQDSRTQSTPSLGMHAAMPDGMTLPQSSSSLPAPGATTTAREHSMPHSAPVHTPESTSNLSQFQSSSILQRIGVIIRGTDQLVRLDIRQNMGSVRVAVHSDDAALASRLRDSLPELLNRLDDRGLQARVTSLGNQNILPLARGESGNGAGRNSGGWSQDPTRQQQQRERNPQRAWRAATWKLHEE